MIKHGLTLFIILVLAGCQSAPTKIYEKSVVNSGQLKSEAEAPIVIDEKTVVLDSRIAFDYQMSHIPQSFNIRWDEFAEVRTPTPGLLKKDLFKMTRRLARLGISPTTKVVIVGNADAEEGRLAWTLYYLGVDSVQFAPVSYFQNVRFTNAEPAPPKAVAIWKPKVKESVLISKKEVIEGIRKAQVRIIDVRSKEEYFQKIPVNLTYRYPDLNAINIEWKQFFKADGRVNFAIKEKLHGLGIGPNDKVVLIDSIGVRSAAATMALLSMGFSKATNYAGGYAELYR